VHHVSCAVIFPGQGERDVPSALARLHEEAPDWVRQLEEVVGLDLAALLARGGRALERTELYQPTLVTLCLHAWQRLARQHSVAFVAGHSLGALAAWAVVHQVEPRVAVSLAHQRGLGMAAVARDVGGGMVTTRRGDVDELLSLAQAAGGRACLALENGRDELVLSGDRLALAAWSSRARPLAGQGPWHGPWLEPAAAALRAVLPEGLQRLATPEWVGAIEPDAQLTQPVRWVQVIDALVARGVTEVFLAGPGRVQRSLLRGLAPTLDVHLDGVP
jgi:[acyl-carrier-protein] S-malonyltransferase